MKKKMIVFAIFVVILVVSLIVPLIYTKPIFLGYYKGNIIKSELNGCVYVLETENDIYELVDYDGRERENVIVYYYEVLFRGTICMIGPMIHSILIFNT